MSMKTRNNCYQLKKIQSHCTLSTDNTLSVVGYDQLAMKKNKTKKRTNFGNSSEQPRASK